MSFCPVMSVGQWKSLSPHEDSNQRPWDHQSAESEDLRFDSLR